VCGRKQPESELDHTDGRLDVLQRIGFGHIQSFRRAVTAQGIQIGSSSGTFSSNPINQVNITGGTLFWIAQTSIFQKSPARIMPQRLRWHDRRHRRLVPGMQCADEPDQHQRRHHFSGRGRQWQSLRHGHPSALTGTGGFKKTGGGNLTYRTNTFSGVTEIDGGTIIVSAMAASSQQWIKITKHTSSLVEQRKRESNQPAQ